MSVTLDWMGWWMLQKKNEWEGLGENQEVGTWNLLISAWLRYMIPTWVKMRITTLLVIKNRWRVMWYRKTRRIATLILDIYWRHTVESCRSHCRNVDESKFAATLHDLQKTFYWNWYMLWQVLPEYWKIKKRMTAFSKKEGGTKSSWAYYGYYYSWACELLWGTVLFLLQETGRKRGRYWLQDSVAFESEVVGRTKNWNVSII